MEKTEAEKKKTPCDAEDEKKNYNDAVAAEDAVNK